MFGLTVEHLLCCSCYRQLVPPLIIPPVSVYDVMNHFTVNANKRLEDIRTSWSALSQGVEFCNNQLTVHVHFSSFIFIACKYSTIFQVSKSCFLCIFYQRVCICTIFFLIVLNAAIKLAVCSLGTPQNYRNNITTVMNYS